MAKLQPHWHQLRILPELQGLCVRTVLDTAARRYGCGGTQELQGSPKSPMDMWKETSRFLESDGK